MVHLGVFSKLHTKNDANETGIRIFNSYFETKTEANVNPHTYDYFIFYIFFPKVASTSTKTGNIINEGFQKNIFT